MNDIRKTGTVGVIEYKTLGSDKNQYLHFAEWWNGEGCDFTFNHGKKVERHIGLHMDDLEALVTAAIACGFIDVDVCKEKAEELERASGERAERIRQFSNLQKGPAF